MIPAPALQHRQHALICDFLDHALLSLQEEAALATSWIKDRLEGLKLQILALAIRTCRSTCSLPENLTADVHYAINKCESFGPVRHLILHGSYLRRWQSFDVVCLPNVHFQCCMPLQGTLGYDFLTSLRPAVNPLSGCSSGKPGTPAPTDYSRKRRRRDQLSITTKFCLL